MRNFLLAFLLFLRRLFVELEPPSECCPRTGGTNGIGRTTGSDDGSNFGFLKGWHGRFIPVLVSESAAVECIPVLTSITADVGCIPVLASVIAGVGWIPAVASGIVGIECIPTLASGVAGIGCIPELDLGIAVVGT